MALKFSRKDSSRTIPAEKTKLLSLVNRLFFSEHKVRNFSIAFGVVMAVWMLSGLFKGHEKDLQTETKIATVKAFHSSPSIKNASIQLSGYTKAHLSTELKSEIDGTVGKLTANDGQFLKKGQPIVELRIDNKNYEFSKAEAELQKQRLNYKAITKLKEKGLSSDAQVNTANANFKLAESEYNTAFLSVDKTRIKAPFDGFIDEIKVSRGDYISAGTSIIGTYTATSPLAAVSFIPQNEIDNFKDAEVAVIYTKDGQEVMAEVSFISKVASPTSRSFTFEARFENTDEKFQIGESVKISLLSKTSSLVHKIPKSSLVLDSSGKLAVKVLGNDAIVQSVNVSLVEEDSDSFWISGLDSEADIITLGANLVNEGEKVKVENS